jgi:hypothetical protein
VSENLDSTSEISETVKFFEITMSKKKKDGEIIILLCSIKFCCPYLKMRNFMNVSLTSEIVQNSSRLFLRFFGIPACS